MEVALASDFNQSLITMYVRPPILSMTTEEVKDYKNTKHTEIVVWSLNELPALRVSLFYRHILGRNLKRNTGCVTNAAIFRELCSYPRQTNCEVVCDWVRHLDCVNIITPARCPAYTTLHWPLSSQHHVIPSQVTISTPSIPFILLQRIKNQKNENMFQYSLEMLLCIRAVIGTLRNFTVPEKPLVMWCQKLGPPLRGSFFGRTELSFGRKKLLPPLKNAPRTPIVGSKCCVLIFFQLWSVFGLCGSHIDRSWFLP